MFCLCFLSHEYSELVFVLSLLTMPLIISLISLFLDTQQYRTRSRTQTPRTGTHTSQVATAMAQQQNIAHSDNTNLNGKEKKSSEPLFGPNIGPVSSGPAWTIGTEKKVVTDELTQEIVSSWIEKSKEVSFISIVLFFLRFEPVETMVSLLWSSLIAYLYLRLLIASFFSKNVVSFISC